MTAPLFSDSLRIDSDFGTYGVVLELAGWRYRVTLDGETIFTCSSYAFKDDAEYAERDALRWIERDVKQRTAIRERERVIDRWKLDDWTSFRNDSR